MAQKITGTIVVENGVNKTIDVATSEEQFAITGTPTLTSGWSLTANGTPTWGTYFKLIYEATVTLGGNHLSFFGFAMPDGYAAKKVIIECYYTNAWIVTFAPSLNDTATISGANITDASTALTKLADMTAGSIVLANSSGVPVAVVLTGDITVTNAGVTAIGSKVIINGDISDEAAIEIAKLIGPTKGKILATNASTGVVEESAAAIADLSAITGITPGTRTALKAIVVDAAGKINVIDITSLYINGTQVSATAEDINKLAGVTEGVASASKVIILDSAGKIDRLDITELIINGTPITAIAAEINLLSGMTALAADLNLLSGLAAYGITQANMRYLSGKTEA